MRPDEAVERLLQGLERLEGRLSKIEGRLGTLETAPPPAAPAAEAAKSERRADPFEPAVVRAPAGRHLKAVSRALEMLGLVPEAPEESQPQQGAKYKAAMQHALDVLRQGGAASGPPPAEAAPVAAPAMPAASPEHAPAPAQEEAAPPATPAEEIAREVALPDPPPASPAPPPASGQGMFRGALRRAKAAAARLAGHAAPETAPEEPAPARPDPPAAEPPALVAAARAPSPAAKPAPTPPPVEEERPAAPARVVPPPEVIVVPARAPKAAKAKVVAETEVDLDSALQIDLERPVTGVGDYAAPILNALVLLAAAGGALYAGGAITRAGPAHDAWAEIATGLAAVGCGAASWFWRSASTHLRAFLAGCSALLLNVVLLVVLPGLEFPDILVATACGLVAFLGLRVVLETKHPLALFIGFGLALLLPHRLAPQVELRMPFVAAVNVATAIGAIRLHRLQAAVAAAVLSAPLLYAAHGPLAILCGAICAATYVTAALFAPLVLKRKSIPAAALAAIAFAYAAWTVHVPYGGPGWLKAALLFGVAAAAAVVAVRLPLRHGLLRGVFKASSLLLLLAALPAGLEGGSLAPSTLFLALLFAVFALAFRDAFLRAAGALMLVMTVVLFYREGASAPLLLAGAAVASSLCAANPDGPSPRSLVLLLGGAAHGLLLFGLDRALPGAWVGYGWIAVALGMQGAARRFPLVYLEAGAVIAAAAAAFRGFAVADPIALGAAAAAFGALAVFAPPRRSHLLIVAEIVAIGAVAGAWPGPRGLLFTVPLLALLPLPWPMARAHGRALALVLLARCLAPDVLLAPGDEKTIAMALCAVAGVYAARTDRRLRIPGLMLSTGVVGAWVYVRTGREDWALWAATVALAAGFIAAMPPRRRAAPPVEEEVVDDEDAIDPAEDGDLQEVVIDDQPSAG